MFNIKRLVTEAKCNFPDYYSDKADLEILADIQHKGGVTCLVDFSKNVLTSIWFAYNGDFHEDGILYSYNILNDIVKRNSLSILTQREMEEKNIEDLLIATRKCTNFKGRFSYKFWLWNPTCINNRIVNQNSVFIFGLEQFYNEDHDVKNILIKREWKKSIILALEYYFNITSTSVFHDVDGYANSNNKLKIINL